MKPLLVLARITFVGCLWSIVFIEGIRVIVLENWHFDIFWPPHWVYAWNLWQSGWIIDTRKEWAFVLILLTFIPLWLMGWIVLSLVPWETLIYRIICFPFRLFKKSVKPLARVVSSTPVITKKKSYKEVRPVGKRVPIYDYSTTTASASVSSALPAPASSREALPAPSNSVKDRAVSARETLNHTIFDLDDEDDDFDLDIDSFDKADIFKIDSNKKQKETSRLKREEEEEPRRKASKPRREKFEYDDEDEDDEDFEEEMSYKPRKQKASQRHIRYDMDDEDDEDLETYRPAYSATKGNSRSSRRNDSDGARYEKSHRRYDNEFERSDRGDRKDKTDNRYAGGAVGDLLQDKGYDVIQSVSIGKNVADYLAVSADKLIVCVVDKEHGDWLADEERFNDEEPLWFSENSHRISPVRKADIMAGKIQHVLENADMDLEVKPCVVIAAANIINAEDMLDAWKDLDVDVARFAKGGPSDLMPLSKVIKSADDNLSQDELSKLKKVLKKLA